MSHYRALVVEKNELECIARIHKREASKLDNKSVLIEVKYSSLNYKDALVLSGAKGIMRRYPMVAGIDAAGIVIDSTSDLFQTGDSVIVTGYGLSQSHDGGYAEQLVVPDSWVVPLPDGLSLFESMALGTAGYTAALAVQRLQDNNQLPDSGPILVTGATGGVGSFAINMLAGLGFKVTALSGKLDECRVYLHQLGASDCIDRLSINLGHRPLEAGLWGGAVDSLGGEILAWLLRTVRPYGNIAACGLAVGTELETTVIPFIIRGVGLLGIASADSDMSVRQRLWQRMASDLKPGMLAGIAGHTIRLDEVTKVAEQMRLGNIQGRYVVQL